MMVNNLARIHKEDLIKGICFECGKRLEDGDVLCKDCIEKIRNTLFGMSFKTDWIEDIIWCPTQLYRIFEYDGLTFMEYVRWRHSDPFTFEIWAIDPEINKKVKGDDFIAIYDSPVIALMPYSLFDKFDVYFTVDDDIKEIERTADKISQILTKTNFDGILFNQYSSIHFVSLNRKVHSEIILDYKTVSDIKKKGIAKRELYVFKDIFDRPMFSTVDDLTEFQYVSNNVPIKLGEVELSLEIDKMINQKVLTYSIAINGFYYDDRNDGLYKYIRGNDK